MNMQMPLDKLPYDHAKFVDRVPEWQLVVSKAQKLANRQPEDKRVVIFHGARGSGKSWLLRESEYQLERSLTNVPSVYIDLAETSVQLANAAAEKASLAQLDRADLRQKLDAHFNETDLRVLCFDLGADYENLPGRAKVEKIISLIEYLEHRVRIVELLRACCTQRPNVAWNLSETRTELVSAALRGLIHQIRQVIQAKTGPSPIQASETENLEVLTDALVSDVRRVGAAILLFDHTSESPPDLLGLLEEQCLAPLAVLPKVLIVLAGRGEYHWKSVELRFKSEEYDLQNFDLSCTQEQLEKQVDQPALSAEDIHLLSAGYPWSNYILGTTASRVAALDKCANFLLSGLPISANDRAYMETLCVLRAFVDEMVPNMLAAYFDDPNRLTTGYRQCREIRQALTGTTLVKWVEESGGYVIDEALSHVLENLLYERDRPKWIRLHTAACNLYKEWVDKYPRTADRWQKEVNYHDGKLMHGPLWTPPNQEEMK
jgi:hypothetical protein